MSLVHAVDVPRLPVSRLEPVIGASRYVQLARAAGQVRQVLAGRAVWNVNSTAAGGGVAEMLQVLVGYVQDLDIPTGWLVISGDAEFFAITKRLHNQIHGTVRRGSAGRGGGRSLRADAGRERGGAAARVRPGDVVLLHDPQTAGLAAPLAQTGARVIWRCHIGVDWENDVTRAGGVPAAAPGRRRGLRVLPPVIRPVVDPRAEGLDHPAVDRPVLPEEPATRR